MERFVAFVSPRNAIDFTAKFLILLILFGLLNLMRDVLSYGESHDSFLNNFNEAAFVGWPFAILALAAFGHMQRLHDKLALQAATDMLTGLPNRRAFIDEMTKPQPLGRQDVLMMVDIDHFKQINDTYGHAVGDWCLTTLANNFRAQLRPQDYIARIGGEEFAVLLQDTTLDAARAVADRIAHGDDVLMGGQMIRVTTSVGYAKRRRDQSVDQVLKRADHAMYLAKSKGRARAQLAEVDFHEDEARQTVELAS